MLLRLTRSMRIKVGRVVALAYLFCMLAPAASLACGGGRAPCLDGLVPHHLAMTSVPHDGASHDHAQAHAHHKTVAHQTAQQDAPAPHRHGDKGSVGPCCAMMCVSALPADLPSVAKPHLPVSACRPESVASWHSAARTLHYRPPIT